MTSQTSIVNPEMPYGEHQGLVSRAVFFKGTLSAYLLVYCSSLDNQEARSPATSDPSPSSASLVKTARDS